MKLIRLVAFQLLLIAAQHVILALAKNEFELKILPPGQKIYKPQGESLILTCTGVNYDPNFFSDLRWHNPKGEVIDDNNPAHRANFKLTRGSKDTSLLLSFLNPTESLSGNYTCTGVFQFVDPLKKTIEVNFFQDITWEDCPPNQSLLKGEKNGMIRCRVTAKPPPEVSWFRDSKELNSNRYLRNYNGISILGNVDDDIQGSYRVQAYLPETGSVVEKKINVEVHVMPEITYLSPEITVTEGEEKRLTCQASGVPSPNYYWLNGVQANLSTMGGYIVDHVTGDLVITRVRSPEDSGEFTCIAQNAAGQVERRTRMRIYTRPQIVGFKNVSSALGGIATMLCEAKGRPAPSLSIRKEGQSSALISDGRYNLHESRTEEESSLRMKISSVRREDDGIYYCIASNEPGEVNAAGHLQVEYKPDLSKTPLFVRSWSQRAVNVTCVVSAVPNATVSWFFRSKPLQEDAHFSIYTPTVEDVNGAHVLTVRPTSARPLQSLLGVYMCQASNRYGSSYANIELSEARRPPSPSIPEVVDLSPTTLRFRFLPPVGDGGLPLRRLHIRYRENLDPIQMSRTFDWPADLPQHLYVLEALRPRALYRISFAFENDVGLGDYSEEFRKEMPYERPPDPPRLPADLLDLQRPIQSAFADRFDLRWTAPSDNGRPIDAYIVKWYPAMRSIDSIWVRQGDIRESMIGGSDQLIAHLYSLSANTTYKVELFARNSEGHSLPAQFVFRTGFRWSSGSAVFQQPFELLSSHLAAVLYVGGAALLLALIVADIVLCVRYDYGLCHFLSRTICVARTHSSKPKSADTSNTGYSYHSPHDEVYPMMVDPNTRNEFRAELERRLRMPKHSAV